MACYKTQMETGNEMKRNETSLQSKITILYKRINCYYIQNVAHDPAVSSRTQRLTESAPRLASTEWRLTAVTDLA